MASAFAWYQTGRQIAGSVSKALAGVLLAATASNYPLVFVLAFVLSVLPIVIVALFVTEPDEAGLLAPEQDRPSPARPAVVVQQKTSVLPFVGFGFLVAGTAEMLSGLFPVIATEYAHLSKAQAGIIYTVSTLAAICSGPVFGWLADKVSGKLVLLVRSVANILSSVLYLIMPTYAGVAMARTTDDVGKAAFRPAWGALMARISATDKNHRARTMSWLSMGEDAGGVAAPVLAGLLWSVWGIAALMAARIALAIVTEIYAFSIERSALTGNRQLIEDSTVPGRVSGKPVGDSFSCALASTKQRASL